MSNETKAFAVLWYWKNNFSVDSIQFETEAEAVTYANIELTQMQGTNYRYRIIPVNY